MTTHMPDQHWWFFKNYEQADYDALMLAAQQVGAKSRDDVLIQSVVSGCFSNDDRLIAQFKVVSLGEPFEARYRQTKDWWKSGATQRELYSVLKYYCPELDGGV